DVLRVSYRAAHTPRQVDERLALVLGRVLLGVGVEDGALRLARFRQRYLVARSRAAQQPGDEPVLTLVGGRWGTLAAHGAVDGLDGHLACERRCVRLPARDLALARLARGGGDVQRLLDRLIGHLGREAQQRADATRRR